MLVSNLEMNLIGGFKMDAVVIYAHPNPKSFNHAIKEKVVETLKNMNKTFELLDLYSTKFNPVLTAEELYNIFVNGKVSDEIRQHQEVIAKTKTLIFIHPIWWSGMPAILKGYIDRVFTYGFAYKEENDSIIGLLSDKKVLIINTFGADEGELNHFGIKDCFDKIYNSIYGFCGIKQIKTKYLYAVPYVSDTIRHNMLKEIEEFIKDNI